MGDPTLGTKVPTITVALVRNSRQRFALRWTPPVGESLDLSGSTIALEIAAKQPIVINSVTVLESQGTWLSTWDIDDSQANWPFKLVNGAIVQETGQDRVVLLHARVEVQE